MKSVETVTLQVVLFKSKRVNAKIEYKKDLTCYLFTDGQNENVKNRLTNDNLNEVIHALQTKFERGNVIKIRLMNSYYGYNAKLENLLYAMDNDSILALRNAWHTANKQAEHIEQI